MSHPVRIGIGGWSYEPWRDNFYPKGVSKKKELAYASERLTAIEINSTFYRNQPASVFAKWAGETPDDFRFTVKAQRVTTMRKTADEMAESIEWFVGGGVTALGDKLGAINWQFPQSRKFDPDHMEAFLSALPKERDGLRLRHAIEVRHESFDDDAFRDLLRKYECAVVMSDHPDWPMADAETADFAYARLQCSTADHETGYSPSALDDWSRTFQKSARKRDLFVFFISGAKERNPAAALALIDRVS